jgi:hypothetical protein
MDRAFFLRPGDYSQRGFPRDSHLPPPLDVDAEARPIADFLVSYSQPFSSKAIVGHFFCGDIMTDASAK